MGSGCDDPVILNQWHPICSLEEIHPTGKTFETLLLDEEILYRADGEKKVLVWRKGTRNENLATKLAYGFVWVSLGDPPETLFPFPEFYEANRRYNAT